MHFFPFAAVDGLCPEPKEKWTAALRLSPPDPANGPISVCPFVCIAEGWTFRAAAKFMKFVNHESLKTVEQPLAQLAYCLLWRQFGL